MKYETSLAFNVSCWPTIQQTTSFQTSIQSSHIDTFSSVSKTNLSSYNQMTYFSKQPKLFQRIKLFLLRAQCNQISTFRSIFLIFHLTTTWNVTISIDEHVIFAHHNKLNQNSKVFNPILIEIFSIWTDRKPLWWRN